MKELFENAELTVVAISNADVITESNGNPWEHGGNGHESEPTPGVGGTP